MISFFDHETVIRAARRAADMALHGTREEKSGRFLPPPGWQGQLITGTAADRIPPARTPRKRG
jgi:hypothetical protein